MSLSSIIKKVKNVATDFADEFKDALDETVGGQGRGKAYAMMRYPERSSTNGAPFILFTHHRPQYNRSGPPTKNMLGHIAMYVPMNIQVADSFSYDTVETGLVGSMYDHFDGGGDVGSLVDNYNTDTAKAVANKIGSKIIAGGLAGIGAKAGALGAIAGGGTGLAAADAAIREYQKRNQVALNPRQFMLFRTPNLRQFQLEFRFIPENEKEANTVEDIIKTFREASYPAGADGLASTFSFPDAWKIEFMNVEGMINLPEVVITAINVTYNPNSMSYFTKGNRPMEIVLSLSFSELMPIYRQHVKKGY